MIIAGYDVNLIWGVLVFMTTFLTLGGCLVTTFLEKVTPQWFIDTFRYGKTSKEGSCVNPLVRLIQIPKSTFGHFYVFASILMPSLLYLVLHVYLFGIELPNWMIHGLDFLATRSRSRSHVTPEAITLALSLMTIQVWRRMYECFYINAPSKAKMNVLHYICGYLHYACVGLGIVSHAPGLIRPHSIHMQPSGSGDTGGGWKSIKWVHIQLSLTNISMTQIGAAALFIWAWKHQFIAHKIFARTKRQAMSNPEGGQYGVPRGDWFEYVSCPHYAAECLLYISLALVLGTDHTTGLFIAVWVVSNQVIVAILSHQWYKRNFPNYTKKAIIPFVL